MSKKDECFKIFDAHSEATRTRAIELAMSIAEVSKATAYTYYPAWRKAFMSKPYYVALDKQMKEKLKINTEVANKSPIKEVTQEPITTDINIEKIVSDAFAKGKEVFDKNKDKIFDEAMENATQRTEKLISEVKEIINPKVEGINWKADVISQLEVDKEKEDVFITNLIPVVMKGKHGSYKFDKDGVKATLHEEFITKNKIDEALEALEIWERCYGKGGTQAC
ncbi:hypothetical protein [Clostridium tagluense]|uniref:hypothetical protein n=1 Tax=Clostridium tagluense TaxID=360422 RepID=UPI001C0D47DA|nr:hypothetical protein [Clostridium tagluense]MBU3126772.1 hypothetical protein [Clostridium tagluense]